MHVETDHQIVPHGTDIMRLYDSDGTALVEATRVGDGWKVKSDHGEDDAADRAAAIELMWKTHAFNVMGPSGDNGEGYSTTIPHGLAEMP